MTQLTGEELFPKRQKALKDKLREARADAKKARADARKARATLIQTVQILKKIGNLSMEQIANFTELSVDDTKALLAQ